MNELENRFWSKVDIKGKDDCWNWTKAIDTPGYGAFKFDGKKVDSNRMTWFLTFGEFPDLWVLHKCDNKKCCNPNHLFLGTYLDNIEDMIIKGRNAKGESMGNSVLTESQVIEILTSYGEGVSPIKIIKMYGIGKTTFWNIVNRTTWKHLNI